MESFIGQDPGKTRYRHAEQQDQNENCNHDLKKRETAVVFHGTNLRRRREITIRTREQFAAKKWQPTGSIGFIFMVILEHG